MDTSDFYISFLDAIKDTLGIIPLLLVIFIIIEIVERFYSDKILACANFSKKTGSYFSFGPVIGAVLAAIPQCGLSVIASTLYCKRLITKGTLIAVYLATSDEAIPVLISNPKGYRAVLPLIAIKIAVGIISGILIDIFCSKKAENAQPNIIEENHSGEIHIEKGCHSHSISKSKTAAVKELIFHPLIHTLSIAFFIFLVTFLINLIFINFDFNFALNIQNKYLEPMLAAIIGIIPNCAVSVGLTVMYLKGAVTFAACVSGLCAGAGLGILVLVKNNHDKKDTAKIILLLLLISILTGFILIFAGVSPLR